MKRKLLAMLLCASIGLSICACGDSNKNGTENVSENTESTEQEEVVEITDADLPVLKELADYSDFKAILTEESMTTADEVSQGFTSFFANAGIGLVEVTDRDIIQDGDIVKIEVNNFRINQRLEQQIFTIPLPDETAELDTPLYSSSLFADTATQIKRDGKFVYLTTVLRGVEDTQFRDFVVMYDFKGAKQVSDTLSYGEDGAYIYTYKIELPENAEELQMEATNYSCMMFATDEPVAVINITKK